MDFFLWIPWRWRSWLRRLLDEPRRRRFASGCESMRRAKGASPVLSFGGVLDGTRPVRGGAVKLLTLREAFDWQERECNILYLVSSAQAEFAEDLVKICRGKGIAFVWNQNGVGYPGWAGREADRHNEPMKRLRAQADFVIYQSEFCRLSAGRFLGESTAPSAVLLNPVDLAAFRPQEHPPEPSPLRLLAMGTQNYRERVFSVLACARHLRDAGISCRLTVAGPLQWRNAAAEVDAEVKRLGLDTLVELRPPFDQDEAVGIYQSHHILLHPKYLDPCPTVVAEALACGLPVVASRSGGLPEMTDPECARLIEAPLVWDRLVTATGEELALAVQEIAPRLAEASAAARRRAEANFDAARWADRHREIFAGLLS
jgi:glycosyltransferase involved in cell wall biosynthesis